MKVFLLVGLTVLGLTACSNQLTPSALAGSTWALTSMTQDGTIRKPVEGADVTLTFKGDGHFSGHSGCNGYSGTFATRGQSIQFDEILHTLMACFRGVPTENATPSNIETNNDIMKFETDYLQALATVETFQLDGSQLTITFANGSGKLAFVAQ